MIAPICLFVKSIIAGLLFTFFNTAIVASPVDSERQWIRIAMTQEPPNLNSIRSTDLVSYFLIGHFQEGLLRYDKRGHLVPGVAKSWSVEPLRLIFQLRQDARWSDGSPVTAHDFVATWRQINDPAEGAPFAAIMYPIKNAEVIQKGELPVDQLGVMALSDTTLVVDLQQSCGFCLNLMAHATFFPVKASFLDGKGKLYGSEAEHLLSNGPFKLSKWVHEAQLTLTKNLNYWNHDAVHLNEIEVGYITADNRTRLNLFRDGRIAYVSLGKDTVNEALNERFRLRTFLSGGVAYMTFNHRPGRATANKELRQAIQAVFDGDQFVNQVIGIPGYRSTSTLFPHWLKGLEGNFVEDFPPPDVKRGQLRADQLMESARMKLGKISELTLLTVSSPTGARVAEYFQGFLKERLGLEVLVDQQSFKQYLNKSRRGEFDFTLSSWYPDFDDILTYADLLASYNANNRGKFIDAEYDRWLTTLKRSSDLTLRLKAAAELQRIIVDQVPILPTAETASAYLVHPKLKGVARRVIGQDPDYSYARVLP